MKRLFSFLLAGMFVLSLTLTNTAYCQPTEEPVTAEEVTPKEEVAEEVSDNTPESEKEGANFANIMEAMKIKFIEGGPGFMGIVLLCLIFGLALTIERIIYLNLATTNSDKLINDIDNALSNGGVEAAKEVARNTKGPIASIFYQALLRSDQGVDAVEKTVVSYGGVQMGLLEKGMSWISLFIALAPMLGFMGTVIGMIQSFDKIQETGVMDAANVAGGIKVALLTTVFGLIAAIILQIGYNYLVSKIDGIVNDMENASIQMVDLLVKHGK
jgi:biopolymer transport protein ExbB